MAYLSFLLESIHPYSESLKSEQEIHRETRCFIRTRKSNHLWIALLRFKNALVRNFLVHAALALTSGALTFPSSPRTTTCLAPPPYTIRMNDFQYHVEMSVKNGDWECWISCVTTLPPSDENHAKVTEHQRSLDGLFPSSPLDSQRSCRSFAFIIFDFCLFVMVFLAPFGMLRGYT